MSKPTIRVAIVDDHPLLRDAVRTLLRSEPDIETVAELGSGQDIVEMLKRCRPHILLLDLMMPGVDGFSALKRIQEGRQRVKTIVLSGCDDDFTQLLALRLGASGYVSKDKAPAFLVEGIRKVFAGQVWLDEQGKASVLREVVAKRSAAADLSQREREVIANLCAGLTNRQIGTRLGVSESTVVSHLTHIFKKVGVSNRLQLLRFGIQADLG